MKKIKKVLIESVVLVLLLLLYVQLFSPEINGAEIFFYFAPIISLVLMELIMNWGSAKKVVAKIKFYLSRRPIYWDFSGEYFLANDANYKTLMEPIYQRLKSIASDVYDENFKTDNYDANGHSLFVAYVGGVRVSYKYINNPYEENQIIRLEMSSESPLKALLRMHTENLIQQMFDFIENSTADYCDSKKYTITANKAIIPFSEFKELREDYDITDYIFTIKGNDTHITFNKKQGFICISDSIKKCMQEFNKYILAD